MIKYFKASNKTLDEYCDETKIKKEQMTFNDEKEFHKYFEKKHKFKHTDESALVELEIDLKEINNTELLNKMNEISIICEVQGEVEEQVEEQVEGGESGGKKKRKTKR